MERFFGFRFSWFLYVIRLFIFHHIHFLDFLSSYFFFLRKRCWIPFCISISISRYFCYPSPYLYTRVYSRISFFRRFSLPYLAFLHIFCTKSTPPFVQTATCSFLKIYIRICDVKQIFQRYISQLFQINFTTSYLFDSLFKSCSQNEFIFYAMAPHLSAINVSLWKITFTGHFIIMLRFGKGARGTNPSTWLFFSLYLCIWMSFGKILNGFRQIHGSLVNRMGPDFIRMVIVSSYTTQPL